MKYVLHDLLRVRKVREDNAMNEMIDAHRQADEAAARLEQRKRELHDYVQQRIAKEERMYQDVLGRSVHNRNLDDIRVQVKIMREDELPYHQRILEAAKLLEDARRELDQKREAYRMAMRSRDKLGEHRSIWTKQVQEEEERGEDKELEDFRVRQDEDTKETECYEHA